MAALLVLETMTPPSRLKPWWRLWAFPPPHPASAGVHCGTPNVHAACSLPAQGAAVVSVPLWALLCVCAAACDSPASRATAMLIHLDIMLDVMAWRVTLRLTPTHGTDTDTQVSCAGTEACMQLRLTALCSALMQAAPMPRP